MQNASRTLDRIAIGTNAAMPSRMIRTGALMLLWARRSTTRRRLRELDAHELVDVGISEPARRRECAKWFWQR